MNRNLSARLKKLETTVGNRDRIILWRAEGKTADEVIEDRLSENPEDENREFLIIGWAN